MRSLRFAPLLIVAACGGKAVIDPDAGAGGTTSSQDSGAGGAGVTGVVAVGSTTSGGSPSTGSGPQTECVSLCTYIYDCGFLEGLCPNFDGSDVQVQSFINGCMSACEGPTGQLLEGLVDMSNCEATINNLNASTPDFAGICLGEP